MTVARTLWQDNADLAEAARTHPFVRGLADGTLEEATFAGYVAQDAFYLESFARGYALGVAHSPDRQGLDAFADLLAGLREELRLHEAYATKLGIDLARVEPLPATLAYTDFLLATAALGDLGHLCAALTPCMRLYAHLGQSLAAEAHADRYADWIRTYAEPGFDALAARLENLLDRYARPGDDRTATVYRRAMRLEVAFFESAYRAGQPTTAG
ncbi:TenA family protein [Asanoa iriomotensis]|uniref:Aminopyrimidine aminohydrolase n=1 Tax=Asanoa iriomotensis TaxID=234613 RepID=A0ABQ4C192_9ACTN|nr:TenA family protein [Asanoa iriomotensis]GIF56538.1 aminopyrimidine aminohydrolase [Asanoa iriomotensis]